MIRAIIFPPSVVRCLRHAAAISTRAEVAQRFVLIPTRFGRVAAPQRTFTSYLRVPTNRPVICWNYHSERVSGGRALASTRRNTSHVSFVATGLSPARYRLQRRAKKDGVQSSRN